MVSATPSTESSRPTHGGYSSNTFSVQRAAPRSKVPLLTRYSRSLGFGGPRGETTVLTDWNARGGRLYVSRRLDIGEWIHLRVEPSAFQRTQLTVNLPTHRWIWGRVVSEATVDPTTTRERDGYFFGLSFTLDRKSVGLNWLERWIPWVALGLFVAATANVVYLKSFNFYYFWYHPIVNAYSLMISMYILSRFVLASFYKPPRDAGHFPSVTVIVVCKNEEDSIGKTIDCTYESHYPPDRLEIIAVDDGSTDATLKEMERAHERHPGLKIVHFETNRGKRHGMAAGARIAQGEILVYVDSDSFVRRDAIRKMVQGFVDPMVGAVCGHANVANARSNLLTKMQEVRYFIAFRVVKAAESLFSTVSCCSGCLAAYRKQYVLDVLDPWLNQTFLGTPATFGDDRSLTNFMLRRHRVIYHSEAVCTTIVPETYMKFFRQQLRWKKSWIRESFLASRFIWRRHPFAAFFFYLGVTFPIISPLIVFNALVLPFVGYGSPSLIYIYGSVLMATLYGLCYLARYRNGLWVYGILFSAFYMLILVWQTYYAMCTVRKNHWGTR
jgi:hyaluronan synthase